MKSFAEYINESLGTLYHFTNGKALLNILKTDKFHCSSYNDSVKGPYKYFMCTTREPYAGVGYPTGMVNDDICKIVLDYDKLRSKFKIKPVDWRGGNNKSTIIGLAKNPDWDKYKDNWLMQTNVEIEERVWSKNEYITKFSQYIKYIFLNTNTISASVAEDIIKYSEKLGIDVRVCETDKEFMFAK